ncbi:serine/threonine protein kinase [Mucilaginibacter myungsuensis]|uniref:Serine/threonine protein kinase n=1 Tax=Mucilaginibacter myungsuensis TaxID=649104 RepID=A0A929KXY2_9SPHI|nr:serine/threonine-protein kinase [Mucilaginibacter myungsuensis]MBE9663716.1 serine/threonine protein kinase [Mucilaginibacter myungsuensis]MDN3598960.1 serine/threonine-protein kinase [Mucilaginibacter myungsuensis]
MAKVFTITEGLENMGALRTGGQGSVYKGRRLGHIYSAVKLLPTPISIEDIADKNYRNFINEVEKLKKVNEVSNPNVVKILSSGVTESGSLPFIEMEYIEGPDLGELLAPPHEKIFTIKETIKLAEQLAHALAHCHSRGVRHGDIKSNNVKYNIHSGNYVLLDFGLSIMSDEQRRSSMRHAGAIEFMAPEQNRGEMLFQTDIYAYGVILYELLGGQVPFPLRDSGETARNAVMISHMENAVPDLVELRKQNIPTDWRENQKQREAQIPNWLLTLIYRCLEKVPEDRFGNGIDLHEAIIRNSVSADPTDDNIVALKTENEILQMQIAQYQEKATVVKQSTIVLSKNKFAIALGVMGLLFVLSVYGLFKKDVVYYPATPPKSKYVPFMLSSYKPPVRIRKVNIDSIRRAERNKILAEQERKRVKRGTFWDRLF